ncbi:hypothetical protein [Streptomyces sp. S.PNR 29]|uniref:hypothetical protein n=1 Tax=Streptomyces sp. S.PNR 29 TaxID=2973805 RepID=UPI0025B143C8|nr:hypothetical protein [Streptomyces sp. S.PNR 29]MDN0201070.1 hypothetical protein [Streptomyces sp. S.PNR 29]
MAEQKPAQERLPQPLRTAAATLQKVPGAQMVGRAAEGTLDRIGAMSPRGRRMAVYTGAGVLGVTGVVEWPVALTGAAVAWLTQSRPKETAEAEAVTGAAESPAGRVSDRDGTSAAEQPKAPSDTSDKSTTASASRTRKAG